MRDQVEVGDTMSETEKREVGGILGKCGIREIALGICYFCCLVFSPFLW